MLGWVACGLLLFCLMVLFINFLYYFVVGKRIIYNIWLEYELVLSCIIHGLKFNLCCS